MNKLIYLVFFFGLVFWLRGNTIKSKVEVIKIEQKNLVNKKAQEYLFLDCMYSDSYFPTFLVDKCKDILLSLCVRIEDEKPSSLEALYVLTHASTNELNDLQNEFFENDSEIETGARECFGLDFEFIAKAYGFDADVEDLIATREW